MKNWKGVPIPAWFAAGGAVVFCAIMIITMNPYWGIGLLVCGVTFWTFNLIDLLERERRWRE